MEIIKLKEIIRLKEKDFSSKHCTKVLNLKHFLSMSSLLDIALSYIMLVTIF